jgi:hypothetical protein
LGADIHELRRELAQLEVFRLGQPAWLPYGAYRWIAERRAGGLLARGLKADDSGTRSRLQGIGEGAGLGWGAVCLFNALEPFLSSVGGCIACGFACSAVAIRGARSVTGEPVIARNFDYLPLTQPFHIVREDRPARGLRSLEFTVAPLAGALDGVNEAGLCVTRFRPRRPAHAGTFDFHAHLRDPGALPDGDGGGGIYCRTSALGSGAADAG